MANVMCPICKSEVLRYSEGKFKCVTCGYTASSQDAAREYVTRIVGIDITSEGGRYRHYKYGGPEYVRNCPSCGGDAVYSEGAIQYNDNYSGTFKEYDLVEILCFSCGKSFNLSRITKCARCSCIISKASAKDGMCKDCLDYLLDSV